MSRAPGARAVAARDAITAVLRDADLPLTTKKVVARVADRAFYGDVYPNLRALERARVVERADVPVACFSVYWRLVPDQQANAFNAEFGALVAGMERGTA